ncbi:hypothetical protein ACOCJ7_11830 [Knoellia sp. CPCC 206453]|uniref:DUF7878 domain-containing protein n=1 Tax=Knoellia pratensis TaxID=3404796 RepID=UPI0036237BE2
MILTYSDLATDDVRGQTVADYLVGVDAFLRLVDDGVLLFEEPSFPICELARSLHRWLQGEEGRDFVFDSMSFEEKGVVSVLQSEGGWIFTSSFAPEIHSSVLDRSEMVGVVNLFMAKLRLDLRSCDINLEWLLNS